MNPQDYDYAAAGFDNFLSRSVDQTPQVNMDSPVPTNNSLPFDRTQVTGHQGDTYQAGPVRITNTGLEVVDDSGNVVFLVSNG